MPILQYWDARLWPDQAQLAAWIEQRNESADLRQMALAIRTPEKHAFLAPWWLSPSISYWSGQPGVAGSSHEALDGTIDSARFFLVEEPAIAREILQKHHVDWVFAYDWERVGENSGDLLHSRRRDHSIGRILDRAPAHAPVFLQLFGQNQSAKLFRFEDKL
jgi:hypothetical protein